MPGFKRRFANRVLLQMMELAEADRPSVRRFQA